MAGNLIIIFLLLVILLAMTLDIIESCKEKARDKQMEAMIQKLEAIVYEYMALSKEKDLQIVEEQEPFAYELVLWWGLDGLRLNKDGTTEWISRKKKVEPIPVPTPGPIIPPPMPTFTPIYPAPCTFYNIASQINYLDMRNSMQAPQSAMDQFQAALDARQVRTSPQIQNEYLMQILATCCNVPRERRW